MRIPTSDREPHWDDLTWEGSRDLLLERSLQATPAQRLEWLEEMLELAWRSGALAGSKEQGNIGDEDPSAQP